MKNMGKLVLHGSAVLLLIGASSAYAGPDQDPFGGLPGVRGGICKLFPWLPLCTSPGGNGGGSDPHGVPEPGMLGLLGISAASAAVAAYRRRRRK